MILLVCVFLKELLSLRAAAAFVLTAVSLEPSAPAEGNEPTVAPEGLHFLSDGLGHWIWSEGLFSAAISVLSM